MDAKNSISGIFFVATRTCFHNYLCYARNCPTVCVTGAGAGVDSVWEQEKLEARKMLENAAESLASSARFVRLGYFRTYFLAQD